MQSLSAGNEARKLIERIKLEHSPQGTSKLSSIIRNALEILSAELYDTSTHFLREFLQNADDNDYNPGMTPWLQLSYEPGFLRVDCNEVGFAASNVEAICTIRSSTKSGENHAGRTGEKGIGFKSVFKIADVVWISSREYAFKFDKNLDFGTIAPVWEEFPRPVLKNHTSFLLQLDATCNESQIVDSLRNFDHTCLLFLRRLRHLTLNVKTNGSLHTTEIRRRDEIQKDGLLTTIELGEQNFTYLIVKEQVYNLPVEAKRPGVGSSELVLAFPQLDGGEDNPELVSAEVPNISSQENVEEKAEDRGVVSPTKILFKFQNVHAILPIGNYGLKFIVHADFLQTANRRHVDTSSQWNIAIRDAIPDAFAMSISRLNSGCMRYSWPEFIPSTEADPFFEPVGRGILARLKDMPLLESFSRQLTTPSKLTYVDKRFFDHSGQPFCLSRQKSPTYLSRHYPPHLKGILCSLGVEEMSNEKFVEHFEHMVSEEEIQFHSRSGEWHSELARALLPLTEDVSLKEDLRRLPIVPLSNGLWVPATSEPRMFEEQSVLDDFQVLRSLRIIDSAAMREGNRRNLFYSLDIQPIGKQRICQYIVDAHENPVVDPMVWTRAELVAHAKFIYGSEWRPSRAVALWVESTCGHRLRSSEAYYITDADHDGPTTRVFKSMRSAFSSVLHDDYFPSNESVAGGDEITTRKTSGDSYKNVSPKNSHYSEDSAEVQRARSSVSGGDDDSQPRTRGGDVESELKQIFENSDDDYYSASPDSTPFLEDIADVQNLAYPISQAGFREFLEWKSLRREWDHLVQNRNRQHEINVSENGDEWLLYLKDVLQVETLPRLAQTSPLQNDRGSLVVNPDMRWLFNSCEVSDVLHVLVSNWYHYAHLIERQGTCGRDNEDKMRELRHTLWHSGHEALHEPNARLVGELIRTQVNTTAGRANLEHCVLPNLDPRFDEDPNIRLATLHLKDISEDDQQRLRFLSISVGTDARYYLKCLQALKRKPSPHHGTLKRLYEELQSRYDSEWGVIRYVLNTDRLVYVSNTKSSNSANRGSWVTVIESVEEGLDLVSEYPTCTYLFRSLHEPEDLHITSLVKVFSSSPDSQPIDRILEVLEQLSQRLKGLEPKQAAEKVKTLRGNKIFPVSEVSEAKVKGKSHRFVSANNTRWYIDDTNEFRSCFGGKVPLLAAPRSIIVQLTDLLAAFDLGSRMLSEAATRTSSPVGRKRFLADATGFLRSRHCFLDPLIPKDHPSGRDTISAQFRNIGAFSATEILQTFKLVTDQVDLTGRGPPVQAATALEGGNLRLFFNDNDVGSLPTSWQWIDLLAQHMGIHDKISLHLLFSALTDTNTLQVNRQFESRGYTIDYAPGAVSGTPSDLKDKYLSMSWDAAPMVSAFDPWRRKSRNNGHSSGWKVGELSHNIEPLSRRIPLVRLLDNPGQVGDDDLDPTMETSGFFQQDHSARDPFPEFRPYFSVADPYFHNQYIGECMLSQLFQDRLGELYDPVKCWTSSLRSRCGLPEPERDSSDLSPFTLRGRELSRATWKLLLRSSYRYAADFSRKRFDIDTIYHFEVFMTAGDSDDMFSMSAKHLEKAHWTSWNDRPASDQDDNIAYKQLVVWVRIYFAFTSPRFDFIVDPWLYYLGGGLRLGPYYRAKIPLANNPAELPSLKKTHRRVDDLALDINRMGPYIKAHKRSGLNLNRTEGIAPTKDTEAKDSELVEYRYKRLNEGDMRLLILFRGEDHDVLRGLVCQIPFERAGAFRALSYVWGPEQVNHKKRILVTPQGGIRIRTSLGAALQRLRRKTKELILWVDAICINQSDEEEKARQISLLPQIFQRSICTLAVVAADNKSEQTIRTLLQVAALQAYGSDISQWPAELSLLRARISWSHEGLPARESTFWQDLEYFFRRSWFRRAWIVQEAIAARTVTLICGKWMVDWNALHSAMEIVDKKLGTASLADAWQPFMKLTEHREWEARSQRWPLLYLLETFEHVQAGLQRDRFFSLLGLASNADNPLFEPDYRGTFESIVRRFARAFVQGGDGVRLLCRAGLGHVEKGNELRASRFPSWVPDWTRPTHSHGSLSSAVGRGVTFSASGKLKPGISYNEEQYALVVVAKTWTVIRSVSHSCNEPSQRNRYFQEIDAMIEGCELISPNHHQRLKETVPVAGALCPNTGVANPVSVSESYAAYRKLLRKDELRTKSMRGRRKGKGKGTLSRGDVPGTENEQIYTGFREKSKTYAALLDTCIIGWRFIITEHGQCGIAPSGVLPGDTVGIVSGGNVPFIFRNGHRPGRGAFLVGECYIDGVMFGECVKEYEAEGGIPDAYFLS